MFVTSQVVIFTIGVFMLCEVTIASRAEVNALPISEFRDQLLSFSFRFFYDNIHSTYAKKNERSINRNTHAKRMGHHLLFGSRTLGLMCFTVCSTMSVHMLILFLFRCIPQVHTNYHYLSSHYCNQFGLTPFLSLKKSYNIKFYYFRDLRFAIR
jgi:hypothetical protein